MDVEQVIAGLKDLDRAELERLEEALDCRLRRLRQERPAVSGVLEYRPYADGTLQAEIRRYVRKDGSAKEQGPYWYFRFHEDGKQKKLYLGCTDDPEGEVARKRSEDKVEKERS
jgi:hypothetical protein